MKNYIYHLKHVYPHNGWSNPLWGDKESVEKPLMVNCASCVLTPEEHHCRNKIGRSDYCLMYVISGNLHEITEGHDIVLTEGDVLIIPPKTSFCFKCTGKSIFFLCVHFTGSEALSRINDYCLPIFPEYKKANSKNDIKKYYQKLFDGFANDDRFRNDDLSALLERLLIEVARSVDANACELSPIAKSLNYIKENYSQAITVSDLAKIDGMCPTSYNLCFKKLMGTTPTKYIISLRIDAAKELLEFSDLPISTVATMCGYADFNFFSRAFKQVTGKTPSLHRHESSFQKN